MSACAVWLDEDGNGEEYSFKYINAEIQDVVGTIPIRDAIYTQYLKYIAHICRLPNNAFPKKLLFAKPSRRYYRDTWLKISKLLGVS